MKSLAGFPLKTLLFIITLFVLVALLIFAATRPKTSPKQVIENPNDTAQTVLSFAKGPVLSGSSSGEFYKEDILIDTGKNKIDTAQIELSYDPKIIDISDLTAGFFQDPAVLIKTIDKLEGRISFAVSSSQTEKQINGKGSIASISFTLAKAQKIATQTAITFLPKTQITSSDSSISLLLKAVPGSFTVFPIISPTPTPRLKLNASASAKLSTQSAR